MAYITDLNYDHRKIIESKLLEIAKATWTFIEKEVKEKNLILSESFIKNKATIENEYNKKNPRGVDMNIYTMINSGPKEIIQSVKDFYKNQIAELQIQIDKFAYEEEKEEEKETEKRRAEIKRLNSAYNLLYAQPSERNTYTHEIIRYASDEAIKEANEDKVGSYPYKSKNIVDLLDEVETVRYYMKLGYRTPEEIEWQQWLDSLSEKPKTEKITKTKKNCCRVSYFQHQRTHKRYIFKQKTDNCF